MPCIKPGALHIQASTLLLSYNSSPCYFLISAILCSQHRDRFFGSTYRYLQIVKRLEN